jgi:hypothetical protein
MGRFDPNDRHSDDLIAAIQHATHTINHTLREGFSLIALHIASSQGVDNSKAIEDTAQKLKGFTDNLTKSLPPT